MLVWLKVAQMAELMVVMTVVVKAAMTAVMMAVW